MSRPGTAPIGGTNPDKGKKNKGKWTKAPRIYRHFRQNQTSNRIVVPEPMTSHSTTHFPNGQLPCQIGTNSGIVLPGAGVFGRRGRLGAESQGASQDVRSERRAPSQDRQDQLPDQAAGQGPIAYWLSFFTGAFTAKTDGQAPRFVHQAALWLVALAIAAGAVVFAEPAPVDLLMAGLILLLPLIGLAPFKPELLMYFCLWLVITFGGLIASTQGTMLPIHTKHTIITLFLALGGLVLASFIAQRPRKHGEIILNAQLIAATIAATAGIIGYLGLLPGAHELFTKFGRAAGTFKDPNVFGPFVGFAAVYALHLCRVTPTRHLALPVAMFGLLMLGLLLSFSRGAWLSFALSVIVYGYLQFVTARDGSERLKLIGLALIATLGAALALLVALQFEQIADLMAQRASLSQDYDMGHDGRFDGHLKAIELLLVHPLGLGAIEFTNGYHHEDVHNVYLSMFLNAGWIGGFGFIIAVLIPLYVGLTHSFRSGKTQALFHIVFAVYVGTLAESIIIDTDHWRHLYLLIALVMGLWAGTRSGDSAESAVKAGEPSRAYLPAACSALALRGAGQAAAVRAPVARTGAAPSPSDLVTAHVSSAVAPRAREGAAAPLQRLRAAKKLRRVGPATSVPQVSQPRKAKIIGKANGGEGARTLGSRLSGNVTQTIFTPERGAGRNALPKGWRDCKAIDVELPAGLSAYDGGDDHVWIVTDWKPV